MPNLKTISINKVKQKSPKIVKVITKARISYQWSGEEIHRSVETNK